MFTWCSEPRHLRLNFNNCTTINNCILSHARARSPFTTKTNRTGDNNFLLSQHHLSLSEKTPFYREPCFPKLCLTSRRTCDIGKSVFCAHTRIHAVSDAKSMTHTNTDYSTRIVAETRLILSLFSKNVTRN